MKAKRTILLSTLMVVASLLIFSCKKETTNGPVTPGEDNLAGEYFEDVKLDPTKAYQLNGAMVINSGTLTIPAGTKITAQGNTTSYIAIAQGAKIDVQGTESAPVVMTSTVKEAGSWGGLVICGKAPVNTGDGGLSEVGNLPYGGDDVNDNSGVLKYLRVEYTGYVYTNEKQFNGVSFFGVGAGTTVDYVVSYKGNDDGIEFFGGTVNASHLVSSESGDDGIDFADGWSGTGEYWYALNAVKSGIEGSNNGDNGAASPMTNAKISKITVYGMGEKPWFLKEGAGSQKVDDVVIGGLTNLKKAPYLYIESGDNDAVERAKAGDIAFTNVKFIDVAESDKANENVSYTENNDATGAGNGIQMPSWMPAALNNVDGGETVFPVDLINPEVISAKELGGVEITGYSTLDASVAYTLNGALIIKENGSLQVPAGTVVTAKGNTTSYIAVSQGGKIYVRGSAEAPVVFTSDVKEAGSWGGLILCGKAPVNTGDGGLSEVGNLPYGGTVPDDSSGSLKYVRVEYTGYVYTNEKQFNGVSFFGVGSGTEVDYVSSFEGNDDGIEFFGGAVNASHLVSINSNDDGIDFADGWSGTGMYWYALNSAKSGIEGSNNGDNGAATPMTSATIKNATVIGMGEKPWFLKEGAGVQTIDNVVIGGLTNVDKAPYFYIETGDDDATDRAKDGDITITNVLFDNIGEVAKANDALTITESATATGAGNGAGEPSWAAGWAKPE